MKKSARARLRVLARAGAVTPLVLLAAGCGAASSVAAPQAHSASRSPSASPSPAQQFLPGNEMMSMLLPASGVPTGFKLVRGSVRNTGNSVLPATTVKVSRKAACKRLGGPGWITAAGIGSAAFVENAYGNSGHTAEVGQEIDGFHGDGAQQVMSRLWLVFGRCLSFTEPYNGMTANVTLVRSRVAGLGGPAIKAVETTPIFQGGVTMAAIRVGSYVVSFIYSSPASDLGAGAVRMAKTIATNLAHRM